MKIAFLYILPIVLLFSACDFLEVTSPNDIDAENAITTAGDAENALTGLYSSMQNENYYGGNYLLIADALGDNCTTGGFDNPLLDEIGGKAVTSSNLYVENLWSSIYRTIANCNYLLGALPDIDDLDSDRAGQIEGQARAIRAMAHFDLLRYFGYHWDENSALGIPVITTVQSVDDKVARATVKQSYDFIVAELEAALPLVDQSDRNAKYVNSATVEALLARVSLYRKAYGDAADHAGAIIDNNEFAFLPADKFANIYFLRQTSESIFELFFDNQNRSSYNSLTYSRPDALRTELTFMASATLHDFFAAQPGDVRATLLDYSLENNDASITSDGSGRTEKYRGEDSKDNPAYIIRLAEVYLIRAEALGLAGGGLADLNAIRAQRGLGPVNPASEAEFQQAVFDERRAELNFEGHIYFDLARTGRAAEVLGDDFKAALPIPLHEIIATGGVIVQNPGY